MPRMSKKAKEEWSLYLNARNRKAYTELCRCCRQRCKQSFRVVLLACPMYISKRTGHREGGDEHKRR